MARNQLPREFEADITDLSHEGRGVARVDGKVVFIDGALPGERVRAWRSRRGRHFDEARTLEVLHASPDRVPARCAHYGQCSGCVLQHLHPERQIEAKQRVLIENLARIGKVEAERWLPPLRAASWGYRRKGRFSVRWVEKKGRALLGFREVNPRFVADLRECHTVVPEIAAQLPALAELVNTLDACKQIPQIEFIAGATAAALVFRHLQALGADDIERLRAFARRSGLHVYLQPGGPDSLHALDDVEPDLYWRIPDYGLELAFRPLDFIQVNADLNLLMIARAIELLAPQEDERVLDLFAGLGNFTLPLARKAADVVGIEGEAGLVARARANAKRNGLANVRFFVADLSRDMRGEVWMAGGFHKILLDPPRAGAAEVLAQLPLKGVRRIVYVSCHPGSLARDAGYLVHERGWRLSAAGVMDMFPHTAHVESMALFVRE